ncbi:MAG: N-acetylmuramoyl-L-alanine amidase [Deltaproteobacteria bacterium]|nr:N-acetylmuramoyl-L-alanine amidase [Deltaproteobacteria bacterium]
MFGSTLTWRTTGGLAALALLSIATPARPAPPSPAEVIERLGRESPPGPDGRPLFPPDLRIVSHSRGPGGERLLVAGSFARPADAAGVDEEVLDALRLETLLGALDAAGVEGGVEVLVAAPGGEPRPLGGLDLPLVLPRPPPAGVIATLPPSPLLLDLPLGGSLEGRRIGVSAGHGWIDDGAGGWRTQRVNWTFSSSARGITEDFFNAEIATHWVIPLLQRMGAEVVVVREPGMDTAPSVIVDDGNTGHSEVGTWADGTGTGSYDGDYRTAAPGASSTAVYALADAPAAWGERRLALRWLEGTNRTSRAVLTLEHAGGTRTYLVDQRRPGTLWLDLGLAWLGPTSRLTLSPGAGDGYLIADALKIGGGTFTTASKPWWEMAAKSYVPFAGAPTAVNSLGDVTIRPAYVEYAGVDLYVSLHGNASGTAGGSTANGMSTYRYSCQLYGDHSTSTAATGCDDPPGSTALIDAVHAAILEKVRADWDPNFGDRGRRVANFGELRVLDDAPGVLVEAAFFDNLSAPSGSPPPRYPDNRTMHDPRWREAYARGVVAGIARFFDPGADAPPPRPTHLIARNRLDGRLEIGWEPVPGATRYAVQQARLGEGRPGRAFDSGTLVDAPPLLLGPEALEPGAAYAFRVVAASDDGLGLPSEVVVAGYRGAHDLPGPPVTSAEALVVSAYDRHDAWVQEIDNDRQHAIEHGEALVGLTSGDLHFDGASDEALVTGAVDPADYRLVDVIVGKNSTEHRALKVELRDALAAAHAGGTILVLSGEELGYHLGNTSTDPDDLAFLEGTLGARYAADDANTFQLQAVTGALFEGLRGLDFDDGNGGIYEVRYPDVLEALGDAQVVLTYPDGTGAAVARPGAYTFGVGLEAVVSVTARRSIFDRILAQALPGLPSGDRDLDGASDACELQYGLDPLDGRDGALDPDEDGVSTADECAAGTDPVEGLTPDGGILPDAGDGRRHLVVTGHCGCTASGAAPQALGLALAILLALAARRRRAT